MRWEQGFASSVAPARGGGGGGGRERACVLLKINPAGPGEPGDGAGALCEEFRVGRDGGVGGSRFVLEEIPVILGECHRAREN